MACDATPSTTAVATPDPQVSRFGADQGGRFRGEAQVTVAPTVSTSRFREEPDFQLEAAEEAPDSSWPQIDRREGDRRLGDRRSSIPDNLSELPPPPRTAPEADPSHDEADLFADWDEISNFAVNDDEFGSIDQQFDQQSDQQFDHQQQHERLHDQWWAGSDRSASHMYESQGPEVSDVYDDDLYGESIGGGYDRDATAAYRLDDSIYADERDLPHDGYSDQVYPDSGMSAAGAFEYAEDDYADDYAEDDRADEPYGEPAQRIGRARFADDIDLDEPDQFESDEWSFEDDDESFDEFESREPGGRSKRPAPRRKSAAAVRHGGAGDLSEFIRMHSKILVVFAILAVILLLSTIGSKTFARTASAESGGAATVTCASAAGGTAQTGGTAPRRGALQKEIVTPPGWTAKADYEAGTGEIDFSRALDLEPVGAKALATLDRTRFVIGHDRKFSSDTGTSSRGTSSRDRPDQNIVGVAIYQFAGDACAADYLESRDLPADAELLTTDIAGARAWKVGSAAELFAAVDNRVMIVSIDDYSASLDLFAQIATTQYRALASV